jgi:MarR family transcriptional regulator, organic hydroperoxide resistance regulator
VAHVPPGVFVTHQRANLIDQILKARYTVFQATSALAVPVWIDLELTMSQVKGLRTLAHHNPATITQIADVLKISQPTASQLVDRLVQGGLAQRSEDPTDRRRMLVRLSKKGQQLHERLRGVWRARFRTWLQRMDTDELEALHRGYGALERIVLEQNSGPSRRLSAAARGRRFSGHPPSRPRTAAGRGGTTP